MSSGTPKLGVKMTPDEAKTFVDGLTGKSFSDGTNGSPRGNS